MPTSRRAWRRTGGGATRPGRPSTRGADLAGLLVALPGTVLVDSLGPWVAQALMAPEGTADPAALCAALGRRQGDTVVVSDEVGMAVHPSTEDGRRFQDALGAVNHAVSAAADRAFLVVAGRALALPEPGSLS